MALAALFAGLAQPAAGEPAECYDAEVTARLIRQTPTAVPRDEGWIVMRWPWFLNLDVRRVHVGDLPRGPLTVLTVQHNELRPGVHRYKLRRTTHGVHNVVPALDGDPARCPPGAPPARPYLTPGPGQTLDDLRREGEAQDGAR